MSAHSDFAAHFSWALSAPTFACPPGLKAWNGSDPAKRFGVYRNNVIVSLVDALADSYPVVQALVGVDFFRAMAREFVYQSPPRSPVLAWYGADFPDFVSGFSPVAELSYLADVARLEWLRVESWHAAYADALPESELTALLADTEQLSSARFVLHPALRVLCSAHPMVSIWAVHQGDDPGSALAEIDITHGEAAVLVRPGLDVEIIPVESGTAGLIARLQASLPLGEAVQQQGEDCDLAATLALLIRYGALVGFHA